MSRKCIILYACLRYSFLSFKNTLNVRPLEKLKFFVQCKSQTVKLTTSANLRSLPMCILSHRCSYPLMFTNRSSAALWMWKTSSLNRQRQVELCRASFHRDSAAASLFSTAWHRMKPTEWENREKRGNQTGPDVTTEGQEVLFLRHLQTIHFSIVSSERYSHGIYRQETSRFIHNFPSSIITIKKQHHRYNFSHFSAVFVTLTVSDWAGLSMVEGAEMRESSWAFRHWSADRFLLG